MKIILMFWGLFFRYRTWKDRVEIYRRALASFDREPTNFCDLFQKVEPRQDMHGWVGQLWRLPEIYWYKPFDVDKWDVWWPMNEEGFTKRRSILIGAIEEFEKSRKIEKAYDPYYEDVDE